MSNIVDTPIQLELVESIRTARTPRLKSQAILQLSRAYAANIAIATRTSPVPVSILRDTSFIKQAACQALEEAADTYLPYRGNFYSWFRWKFQKFLTDERRHHEYSSTRTQICKENLSVLMCPDHEDPLLERLDRLMEKNQATFECLLEQLDEWPKEIIHQHFWHGRAIAAIAREKEVKYHQLRYQLKKILTNMKLELEYGA